MRTTDIENQMALFMLITAVKTKQIIIWTKDRLNQLKRNS